MASKSKHPGREEIIKAAETGSVPFKDHLDTCRGCRDLYEFHRARMRVAPDGLMAPSDEAMAKHLAIPLLEAIRHTTGRRKGAVVYDSWSQLPALALRDVGKGAERRLRMQAGEVILEFSAERQGDSWDFTARAYEEDQVVSSRYVLKVDGRDVIASGQDCFYWSSQQPPQRMKLISAEAAIDFGSLRWK